MKIIVDDLRGAEIAQLLNYHVEDMFSHTPAESIHTLDIETLRGPDITFWSAWDGDNLLGCGALKDLGQGHGELKSMRTATAHTRKGVAGKLLAHIEEEARKRGMQRLSLETGSMPPFEPARQLYMRFGFSACLPFADYAEDPNSIHMTKVLLNNEA
jgi:putative acetyltransferase